MRYIIKTSKDPTKHVVMTHYYSLLLHVLMIEQVEITYL